MRLVLVLVAAACLGLFSAKIDAATAWSANVAGCVPVGTAGIHITAGAVTAGAGTTVTLHCAITRAALVAGFKQIEITYKGKVAANVFTTAELIEMLKATGAEKVRCGVKGDSSVTIKSKSNICENSTNIDFNNNFYYVRIVLKSGNIVGQLQTIYGTSLTD
jgi:predicted hotdog family 3-hydroxylacyl-ACP dehydratase